MSRGDHKGPPYYTSLLVYLGPRYLRDINTDRRAGVGAHDV